MGFCFVVLKFAHRFGFLKIKPEKLNPQKENVFVIFRSLLLHLVIDYKSDFFLLFFFLKELNISAGDLTMIAKNLPTKI